MLSEEDMEKYHISGEEFDYTKVGARAALKGLLSEAKSLTGFDTEGESFFIQLFTSAHGGCELFITKGERETSPQTQKKSASGQSIRRTYQSLYSFDTLERLISACRRMKPLSDGVCGTAYSDSFGKYFLLLRHSGLSPYTRLDKFTFILEYGKREGAENFESYIREYGSWVCEDAPAILGSL